ncbi:hypothetical protein MMC07_001115 [Pseudocyphellaria aurata]|nr:hypothetical protein [Pseudocyphellaria aurata]
MATPIAENAGHSEVSTPSPITEDTECAEISSMSRVAENVEQSDVSIPSPNTENADHLGLSTTSRIAENVEHSEVSIQSPITENAECLELSTTSHVGKNAELSELSIASSDTEKPEQSPNCIINPTVQELNICMNSKTNSSGTELEPGADIVDALPLDCLDIINETVADDFNDNADGLEDAANARTAVNLKDPGSLAVIAGPAFKPDVVDTPTKSVSEEFLCFSRLPAELRKKIIKWAMTAEKGVFEFNDRVGPFKPNVATGLLRANRELYHEAREYLYSENNMVFLGCGSELLTILDRAHGLWACKTHGCKWANERPQFGKVTIFLGDEASPDVGDLKMKCTKAALENIRGKISIKMLHISLEKFCWIAGHCPEELEEGLSRLNVGALGIFGAEEQWREDLCLFPRILGLEEFPAYLGAENGLFEFGYLPTPQH